MLSGLRGRPKYHPPSDASAVSPGARSRLQKAPTQLNANEGWTVAQPADAKLRGKWWEISTIPS